MKEFQLGPSGGSRDTLDAALRSNYSGLEIGMAGAEQAGETANQLSQREAEDIRNERSLEAAMAQEEYRQQMGAQNAMMQEQGLFARQREKLEADRQDTLMKLMTAREGAAATERAAGIKAGADVEIARLGAEQKAREGEEKRLSEEELTSGEMQAKVVEYTQVLDSYDPDSPEYAQAYKALVNFMEMYNKASPGQRKGMVKGASSMLNPFAQGTLGLNSARPIQNPGSPMQQRPASRTPAGFTRDPLDD